MNLYDIAIARKLLGGGGGGSSDFTTAKLTLDDYANIPLAVSMCADNFGLGIDTISPLISQSGTYDVVLYKGNALALNLGSMVGAETTVTVSGNATNMGDGAILITGDCTITISVNK